MRVARLVVSIFVAFVLSLSLAAQQAATPSARDPQAVNILAQSLSAVGGQSRVGAIQDFTGTGTITYSWAGEAVPGTVAVYGKGLSEFRMDANVSSGTQNFIVNGQAGSLTLLHSPKTKLPVYGVMTAGSLTFPAARIANVLSDSTISVSYLGRLTWNGSQVYRVHVAPPLDPALNAGTTLSGLGEYDLYVDLATYQLVGFAEKVWWGNNLTQSYSHELIFSNYTATNGLSVPFAITEKFGGQQTWSISLSSLTFNSGHPDTLFKP
jgi:hypothetical protein